MNIKNKQIEIEQDKQILLNNDSQLLKSNQIKSPTRIAAWDSHNNKFLFQSNHLKQTKNNRLLRFNSLQQKQRTNLKQNFLSIDLKDRNNQQQTIQHLKEQLSYLDSPKKRPVKTMPFPKEAVKIIPKNRTSESITKKLNLQLNYQIPSSPSKNSRLHEYVNQRNDTQSTKKKSVQLKTGLNKTIHYNKNSVPFRKSRIFYHKKNREPSPISKNRFFYKEFPIPMLTFNEFIMTQKQNNLSARRHIENMLSWSKRS